MSITNLFSKISPFLVMTIFDKLDLTEPDLAKVFFSFEDWNGPAGTTVTMTQPSTGEILMHQINVDIPRCKGMVGGMYGVLIHELAHLKQHCDGRMHAGKNKFESLWEGVSYPTEDALRQHSFGMSDEETFAAYEALPWEKDANEVSARIVDELIAEKLIRPRVT